MRKAIQSLIFIFMMSGICFPDPAEASRLNGIGLRSRHVEGCNNRKCFKTYNGWWRSTCTSPSRTMFYCSDKDVYCCTSACRIKPECIALGGECISNPRRCDGVVRSSLCSGYSCHCCVPKTPITTTTTTSDTGATTTTDAGTDTTTAVVTTSTETTNAPYTGPTLPPCSATGEAGVECVGVSDCTAMGADFNGEADICPISNCPAAKVKCVDGWTVFLNRDKVTSLQCNFTRGWNDYKTGFCDAPGEYWLGLEYIHALTKDTSYSMTMYGELPDGENKMLVYDSFKVDSELTNYELIMADFNDTVSTGVDLFINATSTNIILNNQPFSTFDKDNDNLEDGSCSLNQNGGGWWFNDCTGIKPTQPNIDWYFWNYPVYEQARLQTFYIGIRPN